MKISEATRATLGEVLGLLGLPPGHRTLRSRVRDQLLNPPRRSWRRWPVPSIGYLPPDEIGDASIYERLVDAYQRATEGGGRGADGLWKHLSSSVHRELASLLERRDPRGVARILAEMFRDPVTDGLTLGRGAYVQCRASPYLVALNWHDKAIALGQASGVIPVPSPEQGDEYGRALRRDSIDVLRRAAERLGVPPVPPQVGGLFGVRFAGQIVPTNHLLHLYTAHRIFTILQGEPADVLEIGGGVGLLAYVASRMGARRYCIVDLPLVNVLQGYVLLRSDVARSVRLFGEADVAGPSIRLLPSASIDGIASRSFHMVVNQDSLPEMSRETMTGYLDAVRRISSGYFLSINQEAQAPAGPDSRQGWVHEACVGAPRMRLLQRSPYWMRKGYVEELYRVLDGA